MSEARRIHEIRQSKATMEGAGVKLKRAFGEDNPKLDPFLLLDDFGSDNPDDYIAGFPFHPHRGIETITYVLEGEVQHKDSLGNEGIINSGDVQWMTAGSGIIHEEMPKKSEGFLRGFQLWANLPASNKMMAPRYRDVKKEDIPEVEINGSKVKIICGELNGTKGPVQDIVTDPEYLDITLNPKSEFIHSIKKGHNAFAYVIQGEGYFDEEKELSLGKENLIIYENGDKVKISTDKKEVRFLLVSGKPINEPVAWYGPIVMNTKDEIRVAFKEYREGNFIKYK